MRYTRKFIEARFAMAMEAFGLPHGETWAKNNDGTWKAKKGVYFVDYNPYGGYMVCRMANEGGGQQTPFGSQRYPAAAFVALLNGVLGIAHIQNGG